MSQQTDSNRDSNMETLSKTHSMQHLPNRAKVHKKHASMGGDVQILPEAQDVRHAPSHASSIKKQPKK